MTTETKETPLPDIELHSGKYWFTNWNETLKKGTIKGPFLIKRDAELEQKKYLEAACETQL